MLKSLLTLIGCGAKRVGDVRHPPAVLHGSLYCAARNVHLVSGSAALTALDADRLLCALAEIHRLAAEVGSPERDLAEIAEWREALVERVAELREGVGERRPDPGAIEIFISKGVTSREGGRRASA